MKTIPIDRLRAGDVLLCYKEENHKIVGNTIRAVTKSKYTHAAICISTNTAAEATPLSGVSKIEIVTLLQRYDHIAVFRQPDAWGSSHSIQALIKFIETIVNSKAKYNFIGAALFKRRSTNHNNSLNVMLNEYFKGKYKPSSPLKKKYFCSELIVDCFVISSFIHESAAVIYKSNSTSPAALGRDYTFGTFFGYISSKQNYIVPKTDEFFNFPTFDQIYGATGDGIS
jgi:hypothetical protein